MRIARIRMGWVRTLTAASLVTGLALPLPGSAFAQVVRGTVTERSSGTPVAGVLITLQRVGAAVADHVASTLSDEGGRFAIRAIEPGTYVLDAKRIGVRRTTLAPFTLEVSETRQVDVQVEALLFTLPEVLVSASPICSVRRGDTRRVAALWHSAQRAKRRFQSRSKISFTANDTKSMKKPS